MVHTFTIRYKNVFQLHLQMTFAYQKQYKKTWDFYSILYQSSFYQFLLNQLFCLVNSSLYSAFHESHNITDITIKVCTDRKNKK